jgi:RNA polymerase sigma-70 factor (ECF subfamily)
MSELEAALVSRAAQGDQSAFMELVEAHKAMVYNLALRVLGDAHEAEDVLQDVFLSAFRGLGRFRNEAKFSTWLYTIALNRCRRLLKLRQAAGSNLPPLQVDAAGMSDAQTAHAVRDALGSLPDKYRIAVVLHCMFGYTYEEAGRIMGAPAGTVKTFVHRGKRQLRRIFTEDG